jgi:hypothetical protein
VAVVRLEDAVADPSGTLRDSLQSLGIASDGYVRQPLLDAAGDVWHRNTSFPHDEDAVRPRFGLSERQLAYVEALARPEMRALGYTQQIEGISTDDALDGFGAADDPGRDHPAFDRDFSVDPAQLILERARLDQLRRRTDPVDEACWFVLPGVRELLAS